jgi:hypothetical protein
VWPWAHAGYLPSVEPVPAAVLPPAGTYPQATESLPGGSQSGEPQSGGPSSSGPYPSGPYPTGPYPTGPYSSGPPVPVAAVPPPWTVAPTPHEGQWRPGRVEAVPGTGFGVMHLHVAPLTSGLAIGALMAGIAAILVSFVVLCFGLAGATDGWGPWVAGAFTVLGGLAGIGGIGLGVTALRQIRGSGKAGMIRFSGRGVAIGGISCGATGLVISLLSLTGSLLLALG